MVLFKSIYVVQRRGPEFHSRFPVQGQINTTYYMMFSLQIDILTLNTKIESVSNGQWPQFNPQKKPNTGEGCNLQGHLIKLLISYSWKHLEYDWQSLGMCNSFQ
jgi:hypothetical protein